MMRLSTQRIGARILARALSGQVLWALGRVDESMLGALVDPHPALVPALVRRVREAPDLPSRALVRAGGLGEQCCDGTGGHSIRALLLEQLTASERQQYARTPSKTH